MSSAVSVSLQVGIVSTALVRDQRATSICQIYPPWDQWFGPVLPAGCSSHEKSYEAAYRANLVGGNNYRSDIDFIGVDGRTIPVDCKVSIVESANREFEAVMSFMEITERKKREHDLFNLAHEDPLTGLSNRRAFRQKMDDLIQEANQYNLPVALFIIDLDYFKEINDALGHCYGDQMLQEVSSRISRLTGPSDLLARLGGDEFGLIQSRTSEQRARLLANQILSSFSETFKLGERAINIGASIGCALSGTTLDDPDALLRKADLALYYVKAGARGKYAFFEPRFEQELQWEMELVQKLTMAINQNELCLEYQPQIDRSGRLYGLEALVRWNHQEEGRVLPGFFMETAEKRGMMKPISNWVCAKACEQAAAWKMQGCNFGRIAINMSADQLKDNEFAMYFMQLLEQTGIDGNCITLEFTESAMIDVPQSTKSLFMSLIESGVEFAIDDFGTGFFSLQHLKELQTQQLKIDREFVAGLPSSPCDLAIINATIDLARALNMTTVAEGVETKEQFEMLMELGCDLFQGHYFWPSISPEEVENTFFNSWPHSEESRCVGR